MVQILQELKGRTGWSQRRLIRALELTRSSVRRWSGRIQCEKAAVQPFVRKAAQHVSEALDKAIADLRHGAHRSPGAPALWRQWQADISRREFARRVREHRLQHQRDQQASLYHLVWLQPGAVWAMDPAQYGWLFWNLVGDLASRFRFDLLVAWELPATRIAIQLRALFDRFGAPLVLKRDNGSNLVQATVNGVLDDYGVLALTSPTYYPRYNGAIEYAQLEIKAAVDLLTLAGTPLSTALAAAPSLLNAHPRPCLDGLTAEHSFFNTNQAFLQDFTLKRRKEVKSWIEDQTRTIVAQMPKDSRRAKEAARRQAIEAWLQDNGLMKIVQPTKTSPVFT